MVETGLYHFTKEPEPQAEDEGDSDELVDPLEVPIDESDVRNVVASKLEDPSYIEVDSSEFTLGAANEAGTEEAPNDLDVASKNEVTEEEPGDVVVNMPVLNNSLNTDDGRPVDDFIDNMSESRLDESTSTGPTRFRQ